MKGKPWTRKQEKELRRLVRVKEALLVIAVKLDKSPEAIRKKIERLGLEVVDHKKNSRTTTSIVAPERLVKCGGNVEAAGRYAAGRKTVQGE